MRTILALIACAVLLAGCPLTKPDSAEAQVAQIAVQYGVAKYIGRVPEAERFTRAQRIARVVEAVEAAAKGSAEVTLPLLREAIQRNLPSDLAPEDLIAISGLIEIVLAELSARMSDGLLREDQLLAVSAVAAWVREACALYKPRIIVS
jgi:phage tail protein X